MNALGTLIRRDEPVLQPLGLEFIAQSDGCSSEPFRAFLTHQRGGLLAVCHGNDLVWFPCWPEQPNYPIKGKWFQPSHLGFNSWAEAAACALMPQWCDISDSLTRKIALDRSAKLRDSFRAAFLWAQLQTLCPNNTKSISVATAF